MFNLKERAVFVIPKALPELVEITSLCPEAYYMVYRVKILSGPRSGCFEYVLEENLMEIHTDTTKE
jgi:hypothetical protein